MAFNIRDVKRGLLRDGSRQSHFTVDIVLPSGILAPSVTNTGVILADKISLTGKATTHPGSNNVPVEVDYFGRKIKLAGNRTFDDWTVTFYNDEDFAVREIFENWLAAVNGHENNVRQPEFGVDETQNSYKATGYVHQWGKTGLDIVKTYEMNGIFPITVGTMTADWGSNDVQTFDVTFSVDYWTSAQLKDRITGQTSI